jgi:hypothetical protein
MIYSKNHPLIRYFFYFQEFLTIFKLSKDYSVQFIKTDMINMRSTFICVFLAITFASSYSQWQSVWVSPSLSYSAISGWLQFEKTGENWNYRFYTLDTISFKVMTNKFSTTPQYSYDFNDAERAAGCQLYSLGEDLNGDGKTDFYVLSDYGISTNYRQAFKIFDISTGAVILEKNDPSYYYSYPVFTDIDGDGKLECLVVKYNYPALTTYSYEVYSTGATGLVKDSKPMLFNLKQNFPNPFNPSTIIDYQLSSPGKVTMKIYTITGELVNTLVNDEKGAGNYNIVWTGNNSRGERQPSGVYIYELSVNNQKISNKMILLK